MEPFSIKLKFCTETNLSARNPFRIVLMADFQGKSPPWSQKSKNGAILNLAEILHPDQFECRESIQNSPKMADFQGKSPPRSQKSKMHANRIRGHKSVFRWNSIPLNQEIKAETDKMR